MSNIYRGHHIEQQPQQLRGLTVYLARLIGLTVILLVVGFLARGEIHMEFADGCVLEFRAPQVVSIEPGHDGWVVGDEPVVLIEFDFGSDTVRSLGMPEKHSHNA